jgi:branched-subunit amino acid aminotransferase/4-amino-4-deoxychorismate lyase
VEPSALAISPDDELVLYGRGLFETTRTFGSIPWLWREHIDRMRQAAEVLGIRIAATELPSADDVASFIRILGQGDQAVRLNVGYTTRNACPMVWMRARPVPTPRRSVGLGIARYRAFHADAWATIKSMNYLARHLSFEEATKEGWDDALILSEAGNVLETAHGNIFAKIDGVWQTPTAGAGLLAGTVRQALLADRLINVREAAMTLDDLTNAEIVAVTNSVRGVEEVTKIAGCRDQPARGLFEIDSAITRTWPVPPPA